LKEIPISGVTLAVWNKGVDGATSYVECSKFLSGLEKLALEFTFDDIDDDTAITNIGNMVRYFSSLRSLQLSFDLLPDEHPLGSIKFSRIINEAQYWNYLRELSLRALITTEEHLRLVLSRHSQT
jgi:hypothetical protein